MLSRELRVAAQVAREAGQVLLEIYATDFGVAWKGEGRGDPVTVADKRSNELIVSRLRAHFPDDGIVAEENDDHGAALSAERIWYVDPLDGTKEFIGKNGEFSVMLGLSIAGRARLGVVLQPGTGKLYAGVVGEGAYLQDARGRHALRVSEQAEPRALTLIVSRSHRPRSTEELMRRLGIAREVTSGSVGLKIGQLAERRADLYVHVSDRSSAWDTCGPEAVLVAAGGRFTDLGGRPIEYGTEDLRTRHGILACNSAAFDAVLPVVRELGAREGLL